MTNALKVPQPNTDPLSTDAGQFALLLQGLLDAGVLLLASPQSTPAAPTAAASVSGNLNGAYLWKVVLITGWKQSDGSYYVSGFAPSADSGSVSITNGKANLTAIATGTGPVIGRAIYRTSAGGAAGTEKFVGVIWDNTTTTFTDNVSDANLGTGMPTSSSNPAAYGTAIPANVPTTNTTGTTLQVSTPATGDNSTLVATTAFVKAQNYVSTASDILTKLKTVDGAGSGLDADTLDGLDHTNFHQVQGYGNNVFNSNDLNNWITAGTYSSQQGNLNVPTGTDGWGTVLVMAGTDGARVTQIYNSWNSPENGCLFVRRCNGSQTSWSAWKLIVTDDKTGYVSGSYTGDGTANRTINLGFTPSAVLVMLNNGETYESGTYNYIMGGLAIGNSPIKFANGTIALQTTTNGFIVYQSAATTYTQDTNCNGQVYNYIAFK